MWAKYSVLRNVSTYVTRFRVVSALPLVTFCFNATELKGKGIEERTETLKSVRSFVARSSRHFESQLLLT